MGDHTVNRLWSVDAGEEEWLRLIEFIDPGCEAVEDVIAQAKAKAPNGEFPAYVPPLGWEGSIADLVNCQVKAIYETLRERRIGYAVERWDSRPTAQVIRAHAEVLDSKSIGGPCLDLVLLFAACLEHVGIHPILVVLGSGEGRHAVLGYRLREPSRDPHMPAGTVSHFLSAQQLDELVDKREIEFLGCTGITKGEDVDFDVAQYGKHEDKRGDREYLGGWDFFRNWDLKFALDVKVARCTALTCELITYLEGLRAQALALPDAFKFPADVSFTDIRLPVKLKRGLRRYSEAEARAHEVERRQRLDDEARAYYYPWPSQEELEREGERPLDWDRQVRGRLKRAVILGDPGSGKTWLLKHEALLLAEEALGEERLLEIEVRGEADQIEAALDKGCLPSELEKAFRDEGHPLTSPAWLQPAGSREWLLVSGGWGLVIRREGDVFALYRPKLGEYPLSEPKIRLPIFLSLSSIASQLDRDPKRTFEDALIAALEQMSTPGKELKRWVARAWNEGNIVLLLDAMDEVPFGSRELLYTKLENFARKYPRVRILVTSRIVGYSGAPFPRGAYEEFEILPFDRRQQRDFVRIWFRSRPERAGAFLAELRRLPQVRALAQIPLLLALMCRLFDGREELPKSRAEIYGSCIRGMLRQDWRKPRSEDDPYLDAKLELLEECAFELFRKGKELFSFEELRNHLGELLKGHSYLKKDLKDKSPRALAEELQKDGILIKAGAGEDPPFLFLHLTFQEYLAACALARRREPVELDGEEIPEWLAIVKSRLFSPRWREVILLLAATLEDATPLVQAIWQEPEDIFLGRLLLAGECLVNAEYVQDALTDEVIDEVFAIARDETRCPLRHLYWKTRSSLENLLGKLARVHEEAFKRLISLVEREKDPMFIKALGVSHIDRATSQLKQLVKDEDPLVREYAIVALGEVGTKQAVSCLVEVIRQGFHLVDKGVAIEALINIGTESVVIELACLTQESSLDEQTQRLIMEGLARIGCERAISYLVEIIHGDDYNLREAAVSSLEKVNIGSARPLIELLHNPDPLVRQRTCKALGKVRDPSAVKSVIKLLADRELSVRLAAIRALGAMGNSQAVKPLIDLLSDKAVAYSAAKALGELSDPRAFEPLVALLSDRHLMLHAAKALVRIGDLRAAKPLASLLPKVSFWLRIPLIRALAGLKDPRIVEALLDHFQRAYGAYEKAEIIRALGELGDSRVIPVLIETLWDSDVVDLIKRTRDKDTPVVEPHAAIEPWEDPLRLLRAAVEALVKLDGPQVKRELLKVLHEHPIVEIRAEAARALGRVGGPEVVSALLSILSRRGSLPFGIVIGAIEAIGELRSEKAASELINELINILETPDTQFIELRNHILTRIFGVRDKGPVLSPVQRSALNAARSVASTGFIPVAMNMYARYSDTDQHLAVSVLWDISRAQSVRIFSDGTWIRIGEGKESR